MENYLQILRDTPIPTILVVGGIIFLILSVLQKAGAAVETKPSKERFSIITGFALLFSGIILYLVPPVQAPAITPAPTDTPQVINTSNAPAQIASTATPALLGTITILGNSADGNIFTANQSGSYIIKYLDGAYSTFPVGSQELWQTSVRIYKNRPVAWNQNTIGDFDYNFLAFGEVDSKEQALSNAKGSSIIIKLSQNDYIYLVAVDTKNSYADNPGEVILEILFISQ